MDVVELLEHAKDMTSQAYELMVRKNHDYAGPGGHNPFRNFTQCESLGICPTERGILVRMTDKLSRLSTFAETKDLKVADESFDDTLLDLINYSIILSAYVKSKRGDV